MLVLAAKLGVWREKLLTKCGTDDTVWALS